ncbi:efflux RND transporter periplasmic adaptor subunit [Fluviispira multicolorata]|uniref:Efflux RND transporter periplasmic adaptor subunit n=1 Tax=Fluviispira multicolorata TaxID=2654512 RepID=A0A833N5I5_9BACT|nr:efflux RND transporter periplasmic adaptor subunit [Fluviispira multicolorata]KAB8030787.1 efflux RND transporter periplasmic adaptor subunit [Fluviispira multicolorata]
MRHKKHKLLVLLVLLGILSTHSCKKFSSSDKVSLPTDLPNKENLEKQKLDDIKTDNIIQDNKSSTIDTSIDSNSAPRIPASVKAENQSSIGFLTSGTINNIYVKAGDEVKQGQLLASLAEKQASIDVRSAQIDVENKKLLLEQQEKKLLRITQQQKNGIVNLVTLENEKINTKAAILNLKNAQTNLESKEFILKSNKLYAPYSGVISKLFKNVGDFLSEGTPALQITQMRNLMLFAQMPITYFNQMKVGLHFEVINPISGDKGIAVIKRIVPVIDQSTRTFDVYAEVKNYSGRLVPGSFLEINLKSN